MADAIISDVAQRLIAIIAEQVRQEINLVRGVEKEVLYLSDELKRVRNLLDDADRRGFKDKNIKDWLKRLEDASYEMDDVLDEWYVSLLKLQIEKRDGSIAPPKQKVCSFIPYSSCLSFKKVATRHDIAKKVESIKSKLDVILKEKDRYNFIPDKGIDSLRELGRFTTSFVTVEEVKGRDDDRDILVSKLIQSSTSVSQGDQLGPIQMTSIVGTGGIGKTTLAQLVYNDSQVKDCFPIRIWICVSDPFDEARIAKEIVEKVRGSPPSTNQLDILLEIVSDSVRGKKFLLVLDDVWTGDDTKWGPLKNSLKCGAFGSAILVTTRNERVAEMIGTNVENEIHYLGALSDEDCWSLFRSIAFSKRSEEKLLLDIARKIAKKCKGLPLAAKALGSLLCFKNTAEEWEDVLESEIWKLEKVKVDLFPHLLLSYNDLSSAQKRCFSYCAVFPKDYEINVDELIRSWMALGYLSSNGGDSSEFELRGREYFDNLAMRSLFQDFVKDYDNEHIIERCKMHDIVHDFTLFLRKSNLESSGDRLLEMTYTCQACKPSLVSQIKEYRSLFPFMKERSSTLHVCDCLASLRVLHPEEHFLTSIPKGIEKLIHLRSLNLTGKRLSDVEDLKIICRLYNLQTLILIYCSLNEIPREIGNLMQLRHLNVSYNNLKEFPESMGGLCELRSLNVHNCGFDVFYHAVDFEESFSLQLRAIAQLTSLRTLSDFCGGKEWGKLEWLKKLNRLSGSLRLYIRLADDGMVEDACEAELRKKKHIQGLEITFFYDYSQMDKEKYFSLSFDVLDALEPHPNVQKLFIANFNGSKFPDWIASPFYQLREISLWRCYYCLSPPPLGKLPFLEDLKIQRWDGLRFVGREFLGIKTPSASSSSSSSISSTMLIGFPKLNSLTFWICSKWMEWEDITMEEEISSAVSVLPCLTYLEVYYCNSLTALPHRLLRKAAAIKKLVIDSHQLRERYKDKESDFWKFISHIPQVKFA